VTRGVLLGLMLAVSCTSLSLQGAAFAHLRRQRSTYAAEKMAGRGYVRTAACRVAAAAVYSAVALSAIIGVRIPGAGILSPEALIVFVAVQTIWLCNTAMDIRVRRKLAQPAEKRLRRRPLP
jgi:hypothetical protein